MQLLVHRRLTWFLEERCIVPDEVTGFHKRSGTADGRGNLTSIDENVKFIHKMVHTLFIDVCHSFECFPDGTIIDQPRLSCVYE